MSISIACPHCGRTVQIEVQPATNTEIPCPECGRDLPLPDVPPVQPTDARREAQETADQLLTHLHGHGLLLIPFVLLLQALLRRIPRPISEWFTKASTGVQTLIIIGGAMIVAVGGFFILAMLLPEPPPRPAPVVMPTDRTYRTAKCQLTTPLAWVTLPDFHPQADLQVPRPAKTPLFT
jgi:hypothetical protein